ncbi:2-(3-amino-3-carboxypropyl)histidine synthase subunit 2-like [Stylophora pistillata]|uniref:2-(3-amino-3-carboxypropyl)histidine synthase subunit 2 n=1 Tax=Stylophora pistillata TaxID=50429 RepID=A0A2B4SYT5_STYPI|nr:2-(3-amino-3-carboxypropyl)histidine synthase subunit 2-like [Stylophora pistillata]PFX33545.1 Diphthamide biosynthesis protein 2 [Stylophora pistillata]
MADSGGLSALQFSGVEKEVIERKINVTDDAVSIRKDKQEFYEISRCVDVIRSHGFHKIALQFPDSLLTDSAAVASLIEKLTGKRVFVLADTSYGSCCVDEIAAEHVEADFIIHYGRACLSQTQRLPVLHVFGKWSISVQSCLEQFGQLFPDTDVKVIVFCDVVYDHCMGELQNSIKQNYSNAVFAKLICSTFNQEGDLSQGNKQNVDEINSQGIRMEQTQSSAETLQVDVEMTSLEGHGNIQRVKNGYFCRFGREFNLPADTHLKDFAVFFIGSESLCLHNLMMTYNTCQFYSYDPCTNIGRKETLNVNKALMKRYYMIQRAKDAQVVGIVVGTLGVADYLKVIERLKQVVKLAGKKSYLFVMGKLNVAKMANFMEVDVFVLVACPENTLIDSQEFYKPIVTPFEMELACLRTREWTGDYITDFRELLPGASASVELEVEENMDESSEIPDVSLVTGHLGPTYRSSDVDRGNSSRSLVERNQETSLSTQHHTSAAEYLASRSWRGLEQKLGETPVAQAVEGRTGIAAGYSHEKGQDQDSQKDPIQ